MRQSLLTTDALVLGVDRLLADSEALDVLPGIAEDLPAALTGDRAALRRITMATANVAKNPGISPAQRESEAAVIDAVWTVLAHVKQVETLRDRATRELAARLASQLALDHWCAADDDILEQLEPGDTTKKPRLAIDVCEPVPLRDVARSVVPTNGPNPSPAARIPLDRGSAAAA